MELSKRKKVLVGLLVFFMMMAISASVTRVYFDDLEPKKGPMAEIAKERALPEKSDMIRVDIPEKGALVGSPMRVEGEARGYWFFEADFPVVLLDGNGEEIMVHYAEALDEWMTEDFVPFQATLVFDPPATEEGTLVLMKDNPSGLPELDDEVRIPVRFRSGQ